MPRPAKPYLSRGWYVTNLGGRRQRLCPKQAGRNAALERLAELLKERRETNGRLFQRIPLPELFGFYLKHAEGSVSRTELRRKKLTLRDFLVGRENLEAKDITRFAAIEYLSKFKGTWKTKGGKVRQYAPKTGSIVLSILRTCFRWAIDAELIGCRNPFEKLPSAKSGRRKRSVSDDDFQKLLRFSKPHFRRVLLVCRFTSMRPGEVRKLTWSMADEANHRFVIHQHKTADQQQEDMPRIIPYPSFVGKMLEWLRRHNSPGNNHIFQNTQGNPWTCEGFVKYMRNARIRAGFTTDANGENVVMYLSRHHFITCAAKAKINIAALQRLAGHSEIGMTMHYVRVTDEDVVEAHDKTCELIRNHLRRKPGK